MGSKASELFRRRKGRTRLEKRLRVRRQARFLPASRLYRLVLWAGGLLLAGAYLGFLAHCVDAQVNSPTIQPVVAAIRNHDYAQALALSQQFLRAHPADPRGWTLEGIALGNLGRSNGSRRAFERALAIDPGYIPALEASAQLEYRAGSPKAQPLLEKLVQLNPRDQTAYAMLAAIAFKRNDCGTAVADFEQSQNVVQNNAAALREFGACLVRARRPEDAVPVFQRLLELHPADWNSRYDLALVQFRARRYQDSIQTLLPLTQGPAPKVAALNLIAAAYEASQRTPQAVASLRRAMALAPRDVDNYLDLATISLDHGSFEVGVDVLNAGLRLLPDSASLYLERGVLLVQLERFKKADADFATAAALNPAQNFSTVALGISLLQQNNLERSLDVVKQRLGKAPRDPVLNYLLAEILIRKGIHPATPPFREAEAAAQRATRDKPNFALADDVLAELYLRSGQPRRAVAVSRLALKANPDDQAALYHLIVCLRKEGHRKEVPPMVQRLAQVTAAAERREAALSRYRLIEEDSTHARPAP